MQKKQTLPKPDDNKIKGIITICNSINSLINYIEVMWRVSEVLLFAKFVAHFTGKRQVNMKWNLLFTIFSQVCFENYLGSNKSYGLSIQVTPWKSCDEFQIASLHDWNSLSRLRTFFFWFLKENLYLRPGQHLINGKRIEMQY